MWYAILSGLGIGLFGSFHCVGMCGPIALSLPLQGKPVAEKLWLIIWYNLGRATTYALLGALLGFIGQQFFLLGYQRAFSIALGCMMLFLLLAGKYAPGHFVLSGRFPGRVKTLLGNLLRSANNTWSFFGVGMANGLLPCGLVYVAAGAAMAMGSIWQGAALMFLFGMGTFPLMMGIMLFHTYLPFSLRNRMRRMVPLFVCFTALLLIARGMNLGTSCTHPQSQTKNTLPRQIQCHP